MKENIFYFILGVLVVVGINVYAIAVGGSTDSAYIQSSNVNYTNSKTTATNVQGAIDTLYQKAHHVKAGTFTRSTTDTTINLGFKPKYIAIISDGKSGSPTSLANGAHREVYDVNRSATYYSSTYKNGSGTITMKNYNNDGAMIVNDTGFVYTGVSTTVYHSTYWYFALD